MITPLLTQLTYEGLIDELVGIKNCEQPLECPLRVILDGGFKPMWNYHNQFSRLRQVPALNQLLARPLPLTPPVPHLV